MVSFPLGSRYSSKGPVRRSLISPYCGLPEALFAADFWQVLQYLQSVWDPLVHWVWRPWLNLTPWHQLVSTSPQNGSTISGFERIATLETFSLLFCPARTFFIAADRLLAIDTLSKSNIRNAVSMSHVSAPSEWSWLITPRANSIDAWRIPFSTAALITICKLIFI